MYTNYYVDYSILDYHMTVQTIIYDIYIPILDIISYHIILYHIIYDIYIYPYWISNIISYHIPMTPRQRKVQTTGRRRSSCRASTSSASWPSRSAPTSGSLPSGSSARHGAERIWLVVWNMKSQVFILFPVNGPFIDGLPGFTY